MVSILPSARSPFDVIGADVGRALQDVFPKAISQGYERGRGLSAIDQLQSELASAGGDVSKIIPALARAYTLNPNLERSGIGNLAIQQAQKETAANPVLDAIGLGSGGTPGISAGPQQTQGLGEIATNAAQQASQIQQPQQQPNQTPQQMQGQGLFLNNLIPQDIGELISPKQTADILSGVAKRNGDVAFTRDLIDKYNKGQIGINELANSNVEKQAANVQRMLGFEDLIKDKINKYVPEDTSESEKNIYYNMLRPALEGSTTFSDAWQKVAKDIDDFRKLNESYVSRIPEPQIMGVSEQGEKQLRNSAKPILDVDPLAYNILEQAYIKKGHSPVTPAKILKPLPPQVSSLLDKAGDYKDLIYPTSPTLASGDFSDRLMERNIEMANKEQQQEIPKLANGLREHWNENLSLINMYVDLKKKGWTLPNINNLFDDVSDNFSTRQKAERAMLNSNMKIPLRYLTD